MLRCGLLLMGTVLIFATSANVYPQETAGPEEDSTDLWLTVRSLGNIKPENVRLIAEVTEPEKRTVQKGQSVTKLLRSWYGNASRKIRDVFQRANPTVLSDTIEQAGEILLPGAPRWYYRVEKQAPPSTLWEQAFLEVGAAGPKTLRDLKIANPSLGGRSKWSTYISITLPYSTRYASARLRPVSKEQLASIVSQLKEDPAILDLDVGRAVLIPHLSSEKVRGISKDCAALPAEKTWVFGVSTADEIVQHLPRASDTTIVAILDSGIAQGNGIAQGDGRFKFWQNPEPNTDPDNYHDETHCLNDFIGCNYVMKGAFPLDDLERSDLYSHGTHVAGLASGRLLPKSLLAELDRRVGLMIIKVARSDGSISPADVGEGISYSITKHANIVNMSLEESYQWSQAQQIGIWGSNLLFVVAAGNGRNSKGIELTSKDQVFPAPLSAKYENVITVTAHDGQDCLACFANYGKDVVDLAAPGIEVESTVTGGGTLKLNGTSQATPLVTLVAALLYSVGLKSPAEIKHRILSSVDYSPALKDKVRSEGKLNIAKALDICHDLIELRDHSLLRGKLLEPEFLDIPGEDKRTPLRDVKKLVMLSTDDPNWRITLLRSDKLQHLYKRVNIPNVVMEINGQPKPIRSEEILDIVLSSRSMVCNP